MRFEGYHCKTFDVPVFGFNSRIQRISSDKSPMEMNIIHFPERKAKGEEVGNKRKRERLRAKDVVHAVTCTCGIDIEI